jgi:hypothetical protein
MDRRDRHNRHRFRPRLEGASLEERSLMSGASGTVGSAAMPLFLTRGTRVGAVQIGSYSRGIQGRDSSSTRVSDAIDRAFDSFTTDYLQAQAAYIASGGTPELRRTFLNVTAQRVKLLSQELTQSLSRVPGTLDRGRGQSSAPLQQFLSRRITSPRPSSQSLLSVLSSDSIVPTVTTPTNTAGAAAASLYTLGATNAIEAARVATVNAAKFSSSGIFRGK